MEVVKEMVGRLHPVLVHLPIGFIVLGLLLLWTDRHKKEFKKVTPLIFLWGAALGVAACITGYLQYLGEGYAFDTVRTHLWLAITTTVSAFALYLKLHGSRSANLLKRVPASFFSSILLILILLTGHFGGSITHGEDYLVEPLPNPLKKALGFVVYERQMIAISGENWEDSHLYGDIVAPILNNNCVSCHNPKKLKGELNLSTREGILAGGENGDVIVPEDAENSPMYARMVLPRHHEDHMPPKGKEQPAKEEIALIRAWIQSGLSFEGTIGELSLPKSLLEPFFPGKTTSDYPEMPVEAASRDSINILKSLGIHIENVSENSNYLHVSCLNKPSFTDADFKLLKAVRHQIAILDLGGTLVTDAIFDKLGMLPNLAVLKMDHTSITGKNIHELQQLEHLRVLNLTATSFEGTYLQDLQTFGHLRAVYLYKTGVTKADIPEGIPDSVLHLEFGNYTLPAIPSDSITY